MTLVKLSRPKVILRDLRAGRITHEQAYRAALNMTCSTEDLLLLGAVDELRHELLRPIMEGTNLTTREAVDRLRSMYREAP